MRTKMVEISLIRKSSIMKIKSIVFFFISIVFYLLCLGKPRISAIVQMQTANLPNFPFLRSQILAQDLFSELALVGLAFQELGLAIPGPGARIWWQKQITKLVFSLGAINLLLYNFKICPLIVLVIRVQNSRNN